MVSAARSVSGYVVVWGDLATRGRAGVRALESWIATKHLGRARLCLLKGQVNEAISALEQLRTDFIMFARSAAP